MRVRPVYESGQNFSPAQSVLSFGEIPMYCTKCGAELRESDNFCSHCGNQIATLVAGEPPAKALLLDKRNKKIAGVCAGFARYMNVDIILVRVLWLAIALGTGVGFIAYLAAWIAVPSDRGQEPYSQNPRRLDPGGAMTHVPQRS